MSDVRVFPAGVDHHLVRVRAEFDAAQQRPVGHVVERDRVAALLNDSKLLRRVSDRHHVPQPFVEA
ncbi:hypothetical protein [Georgenia sp. Z1491]|uniref:hypothetical protein n=1 Tax=Georgenia sp. Z1491 TaxID=3416707 RepID=UPI003CF62BC4